MWALIAVCATGILGPKLLLLALTLKTKEQSMKAIWKDTVIAESDDTVVVEGNHYFPRTSLNSEFFADSTSTSVCPWKGTASYFDVTVDGAVNPGAAWIYHQPKPAAADIKDRVAFWHGVTVEP